MSAVEPCLETKEISETNELMESFETVDEDKDSDEESFHLFLEGDEDHNKPDDKIPDEFNDDTNNGNNDGKEDKNQESILDGGINNENVNIEEKQQDVVAKLTNTSSEAIVSQEEKIEKDKSKDAEVVNDADKSEEKPSENENLASDLITSNKKVNATTIEHSVSETTDEKLEAEAPIENEDDILNKHACENSEEIGNSVEEIDPNIEESLLNECEEIQSEDNPKKSGEVEIKTNSETASEVKQTEVTESVVNDKPKQALPQESDCNSNDKIKEIKESSDKNAVSHSNSQKCDDSSNSSNPDTDDLLDISMIKDSAQDDADIAEDALQLEQENEDSSSKGVENMDNIDDSSNSGNSDEDGKPESEIYETLQTELSDSEKEKDTPESDKEETGNKIVECEIGDDVAENCDDVVENGDDVTENGNEVTENVDSVSSQNCEDTTEKAAKRNLSSSDLEPASKRIRLVETCLDDTEMDSWDITELQSLISFSKFMTKSHLKKLTRTDLEEFCIQKLCEAILHKSELGETNHQLKIQEQTIEALRREQAVISKQIKDLEIVNKKLMHEILASNGLKPILPVKITRSVGLQVRLPGPNETNAAKRRSLPTPNIKGPSPQNQANAAKVRVTPNANTNRIISQSSPQKQTTPLLNQVLRTRTPLKTNNSVQRPSISPKQAPPEKRQKASGSFIDLTDEDDKKTNKTNLKSIVPQGVRINSVPKTTISNMLPTVVTTSTTPQLMYVVQPNSQLKQGVLTTSAGQKAVLLNFQPSNGVINTLNNSSVSVIPKMSSTPVKPKLAPQNSVMKLSKHPAPLPCPPAVQGPIDKSLKAIPPRPVLSIRKTTTGIILQWRMPYDLRPYEPIASYQLFAYQETSAVPSTDMWKKVGDVKAMALPMACTLTQFVDKNKYYFAVRPVDIHKRIGKFSHPVLSE